ncbi:MAG: response regulator [Zoogloeaceae bacterium]|nr:response regulator [Zoogloeaceae bacterium]
MGIFSAIRSIFDHEADAIEAVQNTAHQPLFPGDRRRARRYNPRTGTRVLVVDDSSTVVVALTRFLESVSCEVISASDAKTGLQLALTKKPELIFLDIVMPGINGFAALRALRRNAGTWKIPVIMMSGNEQATAQFFGINIGADDFMKKPFSRQEVFNRISRLLDDDGVPRRETQSSNEVMPAAAPVSIAPAATRQVVPEAPVAAPAPAPDVHVHVHVEPPEVRPAAAVSAAPRPRAVPAYLRSERLEPENVAEEFTLQPLGEHLNAMPPATTAVPSAPSDQPRPSSHELLMQISHWAPLSMSDVEALSILKPLMRRFLELYGDPLQSEDPAMSPISKLKVIEG